MSGDGPRSYNRDVGGNQLRELLNRLRWDPARGGEGVVLGYRSRVLGEEREVEIPFAHVADVLAEGVVLANDTFLPYHRVVVVRRGSETLWRSVGEEP